MTLPGAEGWQTQTLDALSRSQTMVLGVLTAASEQWAQAIRTAGSPLGADARKEPSATTTALPVKPAQAIDRFFDTAVAVLEAQRSFAHGVFEAAGPAMSATDAVVDSAAERVRARPATATPYGAE